MAVAMTAILGTAAANAHAEAMGALGMHNFQAPIGIRWWMGEQYALDLGLGFSSSDDGGPDGSLSGLTLEAGVPISVKKWERARFILRPGVFYQSDDVIVPATPTDQKVKFNTFGVTGELEVEVFLVDNVSISASHGIMYSSSKLDVTGAESSTNFGTFGNDFTNVGFHVYLFGEK